MSEYKHVKESNQVIENITKIANEIDKELDKNELDEKKIFKLRYQQFIEGLYLINNPFK